MKRSSRIILLLVWPLYVNDLYLIALGNAKLGLLWTLDVVFFLVIPLATLAWLIRSKRITLREIGLGSPPTPASILSGLGLCVLSVVLIAWSVYPYLNSALPWKLFGGYAFPSQQPLRGALIVYAALSGGVLEEVVYRGVIISQLTKNGISAPTAVVVSCVVFAGIHWSEGMGKMISMAVWAVAPAIWFVRTGSNWAPIVCHTSYLYLIYAKLV